MPRANDDRDGLRRCRDCDVWKPLDQFQVNKRRPDGHGSYCKPCFNARTKASYAKRVAATGRQVKSREKLPEGTRHCPDCNEVKSLEDFPNSKSGKKGRGSYCRPCHNARGRETRNRLYGGSREYHLRRRYGIGDADFQRMLAAQGGVCAICKGPDPRHVDHDHVTGKVRGILCFNCNGGLGYYRDNVEYLGEAIRYLRRTTPWFKVTDGVYQRRPLDTEARQITTEIILP